MTQWLFNTKLKGGSPPLQHSVPPALLLRPNDYFAACGPPPWRVLPPPHPAAVESGGGEVPGRLPLSQHLTSFGCVIITLDSGTGVHGQASLGMTQKGARGTTEPTKVAPSDGDG